MRETHPPIVLPAALSPGDTIGIAAPAGAFDAERFRRGVAMLEQMGFLVQVPPGVYEKHRYLAGSDEHRAEGLHALFRDPAVKAVFCARGGFGSARILPLLDFELIGRNPKILAGFSDVTVLLSTVSARTGLVTFHAPVITALADAGPTTREAMITALAAEAVIEYRSTQAAVVPGTARGVVCGGNLASLCHLIGTLYQFDCTGTLLFLEDVNEPAYRIDRMFTQMSQAGVLTGAAGILLGRFDNCGDERIIREIVREHVDESIPILAGLAVGHGGRNLTLPLGLPASMDAAAGMLRYEGPAVRGGRGQVS
ncbi:MAG: LD-carboxypeptidase [Desulfosudaceae bacterium]